MPPTLSVLIVEDSANDAELMVQALRHSGGEPHWRRVETEGQFLAELRNNPDLILADYNLPQFSARQALELLRQSGLDIPLIVVSGSIGEETAVEAIKLGAKDYLLKDRLGRLGVAAGRVMEERRLRREKSRAEAVLNESQRRFQEMLENVELIAMTLDEQGRVTFCNDFLLRLTGWRREEVLGQSWFEKFLPASEADTRTQYLAAIQTGTIPTHRQNPIKTRTGALREITWSNTMLRDSAGRIDGTASIGEDVTERVRAETALRESESRFRQVVENIHEVFWMVDAASGEMLYISPAYERIWGRSRESLYAAPRTWLEAVFPGDRQRVKEATTTKQAAGTYDEEYRIVRPDGAQRWIRDRAFPLRNAEGALYRFVGVAEDITESKRLHEQFLRSQRMEAIGALAGGIAHDLNNILAPMLMAPSLLRETITGERELQLLDLIEQGATRGSSVIRQLLTFSRGGGGERASVQLRHLLTEMNNIMRETFPREISVQCVPEAGLRPILANPTQLHQVLMNLCVNARDAMPQGGKLTVTAKNVGLAEADVASHAPAQAGPYVRVEVADTGTGIAPEHIDRIFDPFFTTKGLHKGTGLGLSTVLGIVRSHGGFITVASSPGQGTAFAVFLPVSAEPVRGTVAPMPDVPPSGHGELVLVVDDEQPIRDSTRLMLEQHGYRVLTASEGVEAIVTYLEHQESLRVVLTDMMMPVMGGESLIRALHVANAQVKVIATTGLPDAAIDKLKEFGVGHVLAKPFSPRDLLNALHSVLARPTE